MTFALVSMRRAATRLPRAVFLCAMMSVLGAAPDVHAAEPDLTLVSLTQLREMGIAIDTSQVDAARRMPVSPEVATPFPNRCYGALSVSDELLKSMKAHGFTLQTLCIGLTSSHVAFHPETGAALQQVRVLTLKDDGGRPDEWTGVVDLLIGIPKCFAAGTPYLDCNLRFEWTTGEKDDLSHWVASGQKIDATMRKVLASGGFQRQCTCADLHVADPQDESVGYQQDVWLKPGASCRVDVMPVCPNLRARFSAPGSLLREFEPSMLNEPAQNDGGLRPSAMARRLGFPDGDRGMLNEIFDVSPNLPRGYAYNFVTPEGDNDKKAKPAGKGRKIAPGVR